MRDPRVARVGEEILPFEEVGGHLPEYFQRKAERELHETADRRTQCVRQLKEMAKNDKRLKHLDLDEGFLLQYLRARKFNVERSNSNLKTALSFARSNVQSFTDFQFDVTVRTVEEKMMTILPWRCQDGCAIILAQLDNWYPDKFSLEEVKKLIVVLLLQALQYPMTQVNGFKVILDVKSTSLRYLRHLTPHNLYLLYHGTQECVPARFKAFHIVNDSFTFKAAWVIIKHFLSDKVKQRVQLHSSHDTLLDYFPRACLPVQYGGDLEDYNQKAWFKKVMSPDQLETIGGGLFKDLKAAPTN